MKIDYSINYVYFVICYVNICSEIFYDIYYRVWV